MIHARWHQMEAEKVSLKSEIEAKKLQLIVAEIEFQHLKASLSDAKQDVSFLYIHV